MKNQRYRYRLRKGYIRSIPIPRAIPTPTVPLFDLPWTGITQLVLQHFIP
ncbi:hypothetical protein D3OALGA1CA_4464 [Olavius algarvensis associated proteobacterium Delta 3]|nr:hypothetical protein D3OALGA1CA_4464 [Olavius algarvensis associated proteobacterium Delta 3]